VSCVLPRLRLTPLEVPDAKITVSTRGNDLRQGVPGGGHHGGLLSLFLVSGGHKALIRRRMASQSRFAPEAA
jgi:hypothetical protein